MKTLHFLLNAVGVLLVLIWLLLGWVVMKLATLGTKIAPDYNRGSCFTYVLPKYDKEGGAIKFSMSPVLPIIPRLEHIAPDGVRSRVKPIGQPATKWWEFWKTLYFKYEVVKK